MLKKKKKVAKKEEARETKTPLAIMKQKCKINK